MIFSKITGIGSFLPERVVTNDDLSQWMDTNDEWIQSRSGIRERRWVKPEDRLTTTDLGLEASKRALQSAGIQASDLDMILFATISPDHEFPGSGCFLQAKLGVPGIPAIDVRQACSGFLYGMSMADAFIKAGQARRILLVGAELHSKAMDISTRGRDVSVLFGDGAGAVVIEASSDSSEKAPRILTTRLHSDGSYAKELWLPAPGMAFETRMNQAMIDEGLHYPKMNGKTVFVHAAKKMPEAVMEACASAQVKLEDIDLFVFHQANLRINEMVAQQLKIPSEKCFNTIQRFGNTTAATIPLGLDTAVKEGKLKKGMLVCSAAFGSGFTWASAIYRW